MSKGAASLWAEQAVCAMTMGLTVGMVVTISLQHSRTVKHVLLDTVVAGQPEQAA